MIINLIKIRFKFEMRIYKCDKCGIEKERAKEHLVKVSIFKTTGIWNKPHPIYRSFHYCKKCLAEMFGIDIDNVIKIEESSP